LVVYIIYYNNFVTDSGIKLNLGSKSVFCTVEKSPAKKKITVDGKIQEFVERQIHGVGLN
jgi:hypothetical protein